jgi:hypothetical protein
MGAHGFSHTVGRMATRQPVKRRIDPVHTAGNTREDAGKVLPSTPGAPPDSPWQIHLPPSGTPVQSTTESTTAPAFRSLQVSQSSATLSSPGADHRRDLITHGIAFDNVHQNRRQVWVGQTILQLQKCKVGYGNHRRSRNAVPIPVSITTRCAPLNIKRIESIKR